MTNRKFVRLRVTRGVSRGVLNIHEKCDTVELMLDIYEVGLLRFLSLTLRNGKRLLVFLAESPNSF